MTRNIFNGKSWYPWMALVLAAQLLASTAYAVNVADLYDVVVLPSEKPGDSSFAEALRQVAVRVSGSRDAAVRVMAGKPNAQRHIRAINLHPPGYPDGSIGVKFDAASFDKMMTAAELPIWGRERPGVLVWLSVRDASGRATWVRSGDASAERDVLERVALARGLPLIWPTMDATDLGLVAELTGGARSYASMLASGERYRADAVLLGEVTRDASGEPVGRWSFAFNDEVADFGSGVEDAVHFAADRCARVFAIAPGARAVVPVQIVGVRDLDAYARAINYLEDVTLVVPGGVMPEALRGEELDLRVTVRGDATALRRTIALGRRFAEVQDGGSAQLVLRLAR